jgi:DNA-binding response OmpR family regulator
MSDIYKILVAEQKPSISKHLKQKLNRKRTIVFTVHSMSEAIDHLKFINFDILVVDVQSDWDDQNDFQILRSIRWMLPQIRIILLISKKKVKEIDNLEGLEISDLISKPWKNKDLVTSITNVIENSPICLSKI